MITYQFFLSIYSIFIYILNLYFKIKPIQLYFFRIKGDQQLATQHVTNECIVYFIRFILKTYLCFATLTSNYGNDTVLQIICDLL